jgi:CubicO group peptidase (beta-lactamase class C family)
VCGRAEQSQLLRYVANLHTLEQLTPLGALWSYSNSGFVLAARVLEIASGMTAEAALKELVLRPLGMTRSFFFARDAITHRVSAGHFVYDDGPRVARPWFIPRNAHAIGGLVSSARDMLKYRGSTRATASARTAHTYCRSTRSGSCARRKRPAHWIAKPGSGGRSASSAT